MLVARILVTVIGVVGALWFLISAFRTMVLPRPERVWLTSAAFGTARRFSGWRASRTDDPARRHRILGTFAPAVLVLLPLLWSVGLFASFGAIYWGVADMSVTDSLELSGSSLTTLGFVGAPTFETRLIGVTEALLGLAIVALMISFLPTLYGMFSRREVAVGRLTTRAGEPPNPQEFIVRLHEIGRLDQIGQRWEEWEDWFVELGETHTSFPALVHFRSTKPGRNWVSAAESALDTAAVVSACRLTPHSGQADTMIRSGYLALRGIADYYEIAPETADPRAISVPREDFDALLESLEESGLATPVPRDEAWADFCGWRVNYDRAVQGLRHLVVDVPAHWSCHDRRAERRTEEVA